MVFRLSLQEGATSPPRRTIGNQLWRVGAARITESQEKELAANSAAPPSASDTCSTRPNKRISVMQAFSKSKLETLQLLKMRRERLVRTQSGAEIRRKKERHIIIATFLFSFTFVSCNSIMLYYYFAYMINPSLGVFTLISGGDPIRLTYLTGIYLVRAVFLQLVFWSIWDVLHTRVYNQYANSCVGYSLQCASNPSFQVGSTTLPSWPLVLTQWYTSPVTARWGMVWGKLTLLPFPNSPEFHLPRILFPKNCISQNHPASANNVVILITM